VPAIVQALDDESTAVRESAARALGKLGDPAARDALLQALAKPSEDEWVRLREAEAAAQCGSREAIPILLRLARTGEARMLRRQALEIAARLAGVPPGAAADEAATLDRLDAWWRRQGPELQWNAGDGSYVPHAETPG